MQSLERMLGELVLGPAIPTHDAAAVEAFLSRFALSPRETEAVRAEFPRLSLYRMLVRARLRETAELALPRTVARLGALFDEAFDRFLAERGPRSHYLRDVTPEFLDFAGPLFAADARFPSWASDLARHEALDVFVGSLPEQPARAAPSELEPDRAVAFSATARLVRYDFAVHRLSADAADRSEPERSPTALFVYRDACHEVRYLELSPLAAAILERLLLGSTLRAAIDEAGRALGILLDASVLDGAARVLFDLGERGVLYGARDPANQAGDLRSPAGSAETMPRGPEAS